MRDILGCGHRSTVANRRLTVNPLTRAVEMPGIGKSRRCGSRRSRRPSLSVILSQATVRLCAACSHLAGA